MAWAAQLLQHYWHSIILDRADMVAQYKKFSRCSVVLSPLPIDGPLLLFLLLHML